MTRAEVNTYKLKYYIYTMLLMVILFLLSLFLLVNEQFKYEQSIKNKEHIVNLAAELRQSSNDLARLARTYIITNNPIHMEQFNAAVEIREGIRPRPKNYTITYWDTIPLNKKPIAEHEENQESVSLIEIMRRSGIHPNEFDKLMASKKKSDYLVTVERKAMALIYNDPAPSKEKRDEALTMLANEQFLNAKASIMQPIIEAEKMIIDRTQRAVERANNRLVLVTFVLFLIGGSLIFLIFKVGRQLQLILGCPIQELQENINNLGRGDFLTSIKVSPENSESILGWLSKTQRLLAELNLSHFKAIIDSSDDAIISKDINGCIASWNGGAEKVFGYTKEEMIGKPITTIIPKERIIEEKEILLKISKGEKINHFETQRLHKNGNLIDVSVTISPIYNINGVIIGASKIARDISKEKAADAKIKRLALFDELTGLANRRLLDDRLKKLYLSALREKFCFAILFIDLDNFKSLNDSKGHDAGDILLKDTANRLLSCVRKSDTVSRFGGDEFIILLKGQHLSEIKDLGWVDKITSDIIKSISRPYVIFGNPHFCTASIGVSIYNGGEISTKELITQADKAMYIAKKNGRNCYQIYTS